MRVVEFGSVETYIEFSEAKTIVIETDTAFDSKSTNPFSVELSRKYDGSWAIVLPAHMRKRMHIT